MTIEKPIARIALSEAYKAINDQIIPRLEKLEADSITAQKLEQLITDALKNSSIKERLQHLESEHKASYENSKNATRVAQFVEKRLDSFELDIFESDFIERVNDLESQCATKRELNAVSWLYCGLLIAFFTASVVVNYLMVV